MTQQKDYRRQILESDKDDVYNILQENKNQFVGVSDIADKLKISLNRVSDVLVSLRQEGRVIQDTYRGWKAI